MTRGFICVTYQTITFTAAQLVFNKIYRWKTWSFWFYSKLNSLKVPLMLMVVFVLIIMTWWFDSIWPDGGHNCTCASHWPVSIAEVELSACWWWCWWWCWCRLFLAYFCMSSLFSQLVTGWAEQIHLKLCFTETSTSRHRLIKNGRNKSDIQKSDAIQCDAAVI